MANKELLQRTLEHIKANPEQWDQLQWSNCFAGWAVRLNDPGVTTGEEVTCCSACGSRPVLYEDEVPLSGWDIGDRAAELLGLSDGQASDLFHSSNSLDKIERIVDALLAEPAGEEVSA